MVAGVPYRAQNVGVLIFSGCPHLLGLSLGVLASVRRVP